MTTLKSALCIDCNFKFLYFKVVFYRHMSAEGCVGWDCFKNGVGDERFPNHLHKLVHFLMHYFSSSFFSHIFLPHPFLPFSVGKGVRCKMTLRSSGWDKYLLSRKKIISGWCGSVNWALAWELKGCQFNSQPGHMPGFQVGSLVWGMWEATHLSISWALISLSLSFSLPSHLFGNKWIKSFKN